MDYNPDCPAWGNLTWPKVGEFNLANGAEYSSPQQWIGVLRYLLGFLLLWYESQQNHAAVSAA